MFSSFSNDISNFKDKIEWILPVLSIHEKSILKLDNSLNKDPIYDIFDSGDFYKEHPVSLTAYSRRNIFKLGDINADGKIDSSDATEVLSAYSLLSVGKISGLNEGQTAAADTDGDGIISSADATIILMYYSYLATGGEKTFDQFLLTR